MSSDKLSQSWIELQQRELKNTTKQGYLAASRVLAKWRGEARDKQLTPLGGWLFWLILAGRGWGKTRTGAADIMQFAMTNPKTISAVVTPTFGDIRRVAFGGPSGIMSMMPEECLLKGRGQGYNTSTQEIRLWNGSKIIGFSATEPDRLRGPQFHRAWCDEIAAWRYPETFDQLMFGLRLGSNPQCVITTTPKPNQIIYDLLKRKGLMLTKGSTFENEDNLAPSALEALRQRYGDTRLGRQELYAEIIEDVEGALWTVEAIDATRLEMEEPPEFKRVVVGVDPAVTSGANSDETGIIVCGLGQDNRFYVLEDASLKASPDGWMRAAVKAFYQFDADLILAEVNNGGDLVERLLRTVDDNIPYKKVQATRGKMTRAEPIAALYEQKKVSHCGNFVKLEDQMCSFTGEGKSPDRMDALVWALTELSRSSGQAIWRIS